MLCSRRLFWYRIAVEELKMIVALSRIFLIIAVFLAVAVFSTVILAQGIDVEPKFVTLEKRQKKDDSDNYIKATFSFRFGLNGEEGLKLTRNNWDVMFGNSPTQDAFDVTMVTDDRSRIVDLGKLDWTDSFDLPDLQAYERPMRDPSVPAVVGHMYLVHTCDSDSDHFSVFRVENLEPDQNVTISWKLLGVERSERIK